MVGSHFLLNHDITLQALESNYVQSRDKLDGFMKVKAGRILFFLDLWQISHTHNSVQRNEQKKVINKHGDRTDCKIWM